MNEEPKNEIRSAVRWLLATYAAVAAAVGVFLLMCLLCGCTRTVYEPMETVRTDSVYRYVAVSDTIIWRDSTVIDRAGDTIRELRWRDRYKVRELRDTCYIERADTIRVPYPIEKELSRWEQTKQDYGGDAMVTLAVIVIAAVVWLIKKFRR